MSPQFPLPSERQTAYLRASVVDAALKLGSNVTNLMFADSILEHSSEDIEQGGKLLYIPDLYSLSPSAALEPLSAFSHDTDFSSSTGSNGSVESPVPKPRGVRFNKDDLESPFVLITKKEPQDGDLTSEQLNKTGPKKGIKNFAFLPKKLRQPAVQENSPERGRPTISNPRRLHAALDDPVVPIMISMPNSSRVSTRLEGSRNSSTQSTPTKSRKRIQRIGSDDFDLFAGKSTGSKVLVKPNKKKDQDEDFGYVSEGTGLSSLKGKTRRKGKYSTSPARDGKYQVQSSATTTQQQHSKSTDPQLSFHARVLPIAERFVRRRPSVPQPLKIPQIKFSPSIPSPPPLPLVPPPPPPTDNLNTGKIPNQDPSLLVVGSTPQFPNAKPSPISDKSFVMVPDLNIMKRLGLDKYVSGVNANSGTVGANNEIKLQVMEMLLKNSKNESDSPELKKKSKHENPFIAEVVPDTESTIPAHVPAVPAITVNVVPSHSLAQEPITTNTTIPARPEFQPLLPPTPIIRGRDSPFPKSPIRGREPAFPTKPVYRPSLYRSPSAGAAVGTRGAGGTAPLRFKLPSHDRYRNVNIDLPRSVRSSYEKDLEREEEEAPSSSISDRVKVRRAVVAANSSLAVSADGNISDDGGEYGYNLDSPSVYSSYFDIDNLPSRRI